MPTYNSLIARTDSAALIPEEVSREIAQHLPEKSAVLQLARRLPDMSRGIHRMPVFSSLPTAYFVSGDTGLKQTTQLAWANKYITAEEVACIVPIPKNVIDDADYDIWTEVKPHIVEAFGVVIDAAILYGTNAPGSWPSSIVVGAAAAGNSVSLAAFSDVYDATLGPGGSIDLVEQDGYLVTGHVGAVGTKAILRGLRDLNGQPIFNRSMQAKGQYELDGETAIFPTNGAIDPTVSKLISGDWRQLVYSIRQDMTWDITTEGVISDANGVIIYNLFQQDMIALRCVLRMGFQVPNPVTRMQPTEANRYPFSVLTP